MKLSVALLYLLSEAGASAATPALGRSNSLDEIYRGAPAAAPAPRRSNFLDETERGAPAEALTLGRSYFRGEGDPRASAAAPALRRSHSLDEIDRGASPIHRPAASSARLAHHPDTQASFERLHREAIGRCDHLLYPPAPVSPAAEARARFYRTPYMLHNLAAMKLLSHHVKSWPHYAGQRQAVDELRKSPFYSEAARATTLAQLRRNFPYGYEPTYFDWAHTTGLGYGPVGLTAQAAKQWLKRRDRLQEFVWVTCTRRDSRYNYPLNQEKEHVLRLQARLGYQRPPGRP